MGRARDIRLAYLLLAPALLLLLTALAYPVGWEIWTSFTDLSPLNDHPTSFVWLDNYRRLAGDPAFWRAAANTVAYAALTIAVKLALGLGLALLLARPFRGRALVFLAIFLLAGINAVPPELFECAALESKSAWRRFWLVTVPLLKPFLALAVFLALTTAFADLANVWMLTAGRIVYPVLGTHAYWLAIHGGQFGQASALSLTLAPFLLAVLFVLFRMFDPPEQERA